MGRWLNVRKMKDGKRSLLPTSIYPLVGARGGEGEDNRQCCHHTANHRLTCYMKVRGWAHFRHRHTREPWQEFEASTAPRQNSTWTTDTDFCHALTETAPSSKQMPDASCWPRTIHTLLGNRHTENLWENWRRPWHLGGSLCVPFFQHCTCEKQRQSHYLQMHHFFLFLIPTHYMLYKCISYAHKHVCWLPQPHYYFDI